MSLSRDVSAFRLLRLAAVTSALTCVPMVVVAQSAVPNRPVQAQPAVKPKPAAPVAAATQPPATQGAATTVAQGAVSAKSNDDVIARVGATNISADEIRAYVAALGPRERAAVSQDPALLSQAVRMMLANRLVLQEVVAKKWDQQPNVAEQLQQVRDNAVVELYLQSVSAPPANFPSEDDLQKVYDANRASFLVPRQFELAQIFVPLAKDADKTAEDKAKKTVDEVQRKLKAPAADFAAIANEVNEAKNGGELGWVPETQIRPEIRPRVMELAKNMVSDPIKLDDGWHIIKLSDTKASYTRTLPEVRDALVQQIRSERATALRRAYVAELLKQHPPVINELALSSLVGEQSSPAR
ncbi:PpiC-type peptidyl-prolyl cis-trans isomerase precursor [Bradyrhizobium sp. STM 3843]|uniref:peptidyl-prolyl cis-trans isomerase n=1 Tax=Bradyrhizobium sp. STM 3843 TaxID=551947 RepID=UPI000240AE22|nr:peptidyl-prolyl cis-trans isomerase [Bradyrhizobium sp. STM 3843]CCE05256.1 PpiC-type peptidyl-prolyl cis-trans isomerase precursor [Bradyrhizobium sp. STM 3843]